MSITPHRTPSGPRNDDPLNPFVDPSNELISPALETFDMKQRGVVVLRQLTALKVKIDGHQFEFSALLDEVHQLRHWRAELPTFERYVQEVLGINVRTAYEFMRVYRICRSVNLPKETVAKVGWSKVAVVAKHLTPENVSEIIKQVETMGYRELQETYSTMSKGQDEGKDSRSVKARKRQPPSKIKITLVIQEALHLACMHTHQVTSQENLEYMATHFLKHCSPPSRLPAIGLPN